MSATQILERAAQHLATRSCWGEFHNPFFWTDADDYYAYRFLRLQIANLEGSENLQTFADLLRLDSPSN